MIKALIFDLDDTLYDLSVPFLRAYDVCFADTYGLQHKIPRKELFIDMRTHNNEIYDKTQTGEITAEEMYVYRITKAMEDFGVTISREEALNFQDVYHEFQHELALTDNMRQFLTFAVTRELKLGIISNGPGGHQRDKMRSLGVTKWIPKENIIISGDIGVMKPDPAIFRVAQRQMNLSPEDSWYVGDAFDRDVEGAAGAGWHTIWINRRHYTKPDSAVSPDHTVYSEEELTALLTTMIRNLPPRSCGTAPA